MRYYIPDLTLQEALNLKKSLEETPSTEQMIFDFSKVSNFELLPMLMVGSIIRRYQKQFPDVSVSIDGIESEGKEYANVLGFFKSILPSTEIEKNPGQAPDTSNCIPITHISVGELDKTEREKGNFLALGEVIEKESGRLAGFVDGGDSERHKLLTYLIREILRNTPEHGRSDEMWICGQYQPSDSIVEVAAIDEGIGIYRSITRNAAHREYIVDNATSLQWALKAGISEALRPSQKQRSSDEWANSGFGLYMVSQICKYLKGDFFIASCGNYLLVDDGGVKAGETSFDGTAVRIRVPSEGISNAQNIISTIAGQGESEAKTIRNAFKTASTPSKGLMEQLNIH